MIQILDKFTRVSFVVNEDTLKLKFTGNADIKDGIVNNISDGNVYKDDKWVCNFSASIEQDTLKFHMSSCKAGNLILIATRLETLPADIITANNGE